MLLSRDFEHIFKVFCSSQHGIEACTSTYLFNYVPSMPALMHSFSTFSHVLNSTPAHLQPLPPPVKSNINGTTLLVLLIPLGQNALVLYVLDQALWL